MRSSDSTGALIATIWHRCCTWHPPATGKHFQLVDADTSSVTAAPRTRTLVGWHLAAYRSFWRQQLRAPGFCRVQIADPLRTVRPVQGALAAAPRSGDCNYRRPRRCCTCTPNSQPAGRMHRAGATAGQPSTASAYRRGFAAEAGVPVDTMPASV